MQILAIESSSLTAGAAIIKDDVVLAEYSVSFKKTHSQTLLPMIDEVVKMTETNLKELDAIAISAGPGSFTGLRIGINGQIGQRRDYVWRLISRLLRCLRLKLWRLDAVHIMV